MKRRDERAFGSVGMKEESLMWALVSASLLAATWPWAVAAVCWPPFQCGRDKDR